MKLLPTYRVAVLSTDWFASLPWEVQANVLDRGRRRDVKAGTRLYSRGEMPDGMYCVQEGCVRLCGISREGRETTLDFYGPKAWFAEVSVLDGSLRSHDAVAETASVMLHYPSSVVEDLLEQFPPFARGLLRLEAHRLRLLLLALESYSGQTLEQRLANRLLMLSGWFGRATEDGLMIELHLPQERLAQLIGVSRQRVNQILRDWKAAEKITHHYGHVVLRSIAWFEKLADI